MMNTEKKMTYVAALSYVLENYELPTEVAEKLETLKGQQEKRNSAPKKPTAKQEANEVIKDIIKAVLDGQAPMTISEIMTHSMELDALSNQKVSSLVGQMVKDGVLVRTMDKRKAYFALAEA